ncbi:MAG TPA: hypothetical protein VD929_11205 [Caulobacteraceae bacterium]|nr:hypothetical protein [Caulobacteraceae bacterium]
MSRLIFTAAALAAFALPASAQAPASDYPTYDQVGLTWNKPPSLKRMHRLYPVRARAMDVARGKAELACTPDAEGELDCRVLDETPGGMFFGDAALKVMSRASVRSVDGGSPAGRTFAFTLKFGHWPASTLPDKFHPIDAGLKWVKRPEMKDHWGMSGQGRMEIYSASFNCVADGGGELDCTPGAAQPNDPRFVKAAMKALEKARVKRIDGASPSGTRFDWTIKVQKQSHCGKGRKDMYGDNGSTITTGGDNASMQDVPSNMGSGGNCDAAMVQVQ